MVRKKSVRRYAASFSAVGHRIIKTVGTNPSTLYVYDAFGNLAAEYGTTTATTGTEYLTTDHLGSTRLVTLATGAPEFTFDYLPFGEELGGTQTSGPSLRFTGQEHDTESALDNFHARYSSAPQSRFQSPDPLGMFVADPANPQSWNQYSYVRNNPLKFIDPTGLACVYSGSGDYSDSDNYYDDDSGGQSCEGAFASPPQSVNVTAPQKNTGTAFPLSGKATGETRRSRLPTVATDHQSKACNPTDRSDCSDLSNRSFGH